MIKPKLHRRPKPVLLPKRPSVTANGLVGPLRIDSSRASDTGVPPEIEDAEDFPIERIARYGCGDDSYEPQEIEAIAVERDA